MKKYAKTINGVAVVRTADEIIIKKNGFVTYNPTEEMILADGWSEYIYVKPEKSEEYIIAARRQEMLNAIDVFDQSEEVNIFYIHDLPVWLDKATRAGLKLRFEAEIAQGKTETTLWHNDMQFPLQLNDAIQMLYAIEVYASACYDNTQRHKMVVNNELHTLDDFAAYEYTAGYPEKLRF